MTTPPITDFQAAAASAAVLRMFREKHFSICTLDAVAATVGRKEHLAGRDYEALRAVHCMDWADMGPDLSTQVVAVCCRMLGIPEDQVAKAAEPHVPQPEPDKKARSILSLMFSRSGA
jgi:hypothetical protein